MTAAPPTGTEAPQTTGTYSTDQRGGGRGSILPGAFIALALVLAGVGAILISGAYDEPRQAQAVGRNLPINDGARNPLDLTANNSPTIVRNPQAEDNLVLANRIDSPTYSCSVRGVRGRRRQLDADGRSRRRRGPPDCATRRMPPSRPTARSTSPS